MRDVARDAGVALGAAYYYFPSKEALVLAYYQGTQDEHESQLDASLARGEASALDRRLAAIIHGKLDVLRRDRKLLGALFRAVGDPDDPVSPFSRESGDIRARSIATFARALETEPLDDETKRVAAIAFWGLHLALLLYFIHDDSPKQQKTHALADAAIELVVRLLRVAPLLGPEVGARLHALLSEAGLLTVASGRA